MASGGDAQLACIGELRPHVAILRRNLGERRPSGRARRRRRAVAGCASRAAPRRSRNSGEDLALELEDLLLGRQHLRFQLLQLGRGEALGVDQRLLAIVVRRRQVQVRLRDLDVVAEDVVEPDLERGDAGALPLARLDLRDVLARCCG